jgi:SAM-dependent methyltransferase
MPTPVPEPLSVADSHRARDVAESFGADPERYDRARPDYPSALVDRVLATAAGRHVLDVGIGTGILARQFRAAGCEVLGVEVDARMAEVARRAGLAVEISRFEDWDPAGRTVDAVVAGQTWHWIEPVAGASVAARVLRPGGPLALIWNAMLPPAEVAEAFAAVHERIATGLPHAWRAGSGAPYGPMLDKAAEGVRAAGGFGVPQEWRVDRERTYTRDQWLDQLPTFGLASRLPADVLRDYVRESGAVLDALGGGFTMTIATVALVALREGAEDPST